MSQPFWNPKLGRWAIKIGYCHTKRGNRDRAWHYFVGIESDVPPDEVIADAVNKQRQWRHLVEDWPSIGPKLQQLDPGPDYSLPVWYDPELYAWPLDDGEEIRKADRADADILVPKSVAELRGIIDWGENLETVISQLRQTGLLPKGIAAPVRTPSIRTCIEEYLAHEESRTLLQIGERIDIGTFNGKRTNLYVCLGFKFEKKTPIDGTKIIDIDKPMIALDGRDLKALTQHWFNLPGNVTSRRTVKNYLSAFKSFLLWCESQDDLGFTMPKATSRVLRVSRATTPNVTKADYELLESILKGAPERTIVYATLGLFCGFYQTDICELHSNEVQVIDGDMFITGFRSKESSEAKEDRKLMTTHWVPPEIATVFRRHKAPENAWGYYFLNRYGSPMFRERLKAGKTNAVSKAWEKVTDQHKLPFRQLRKWGWNQIMSFGTDPACSGETLAKRWAGQTGGGVSPVYRFEDYAPVIKAQQKWWKKLAPTFRPLLRST